MYRHSTHGDGTPDPRSRTGRSRAAHVLSRVLGVTLAALLVLPIAETTQYAEAGKKTKTIVRTFSSNGQIDLAAVGTFGVANPYPTTIDVSAFEDFKNATIMDVNLTLRDISHTNPDDINVMVSHASLSAIVMSDVGGGDNIVDTTLTLDDQAAEELPDSDLLTTGAYRPTNTGNSDTFPAPAPAPNANVALSTFNGADPDGEWQLFFYDDVNGNTGSVSGGWELEITAKVKTDNKDKGVKKNKKGKKND